MKWDPKTMVSAITMTQSLSDTWPSKYEGFAYFSLNSPNGHTAHSYKFSVLFSINKGRQELEPVSNKDHFVTQVLHPDPALALEWCSGLSALWISAQCCIGVTECVASCSTKYKSLWSSFLALCTTLRTQIDKPQLWACGKRGQAVVLLAGSDRRY